MIDSSRRRFLRRAGILAVPAVAGCSDGTPNAESGLSETDAADPGTRTGAATLTANGPSETTALERTTVAPHSEHTVWERSLDSAVVATPAIDARHVHVGTLNRAIRTFDASTGSDVWSGTTANPIRDVALVDETLVVVSGTNELRASHTLHGFDAGTGEERWTANPTNWYLDVVGRRDETVYVTTEDDVPAGSNAKLYAVASSDGAISWSGRVGEANTLVDTADGVYVASLRRVDGFRARTGEHRWTNDLSDVLPRAPTRGGVTALGADDETVAYAYRPESEDGAVLVGVDSTSGEERWRFDEWSAVSSVVVRNGVVYAGGDEFVAMDAGDGSVRWRDGRVGFVSAVGLTPDRVYSGGYDVAAYDRRSGELDWTWDPTPSTDGVHAAGFVSGALLFESRPSPDLRDRYKFAVDSETGDERWVFTTGTGLTNLAIGPDIAVTAGKNGRLYALR